jgi:steroid delta-isomerase-like uncharacterized protein
MNVSVETHKAIVCQFYEQGAVGQWDDELIADDVIYHGPPMLGEIHGRDGFKQMLGVFRTAFPGFQTTIEDVIAEGDRVVVRHTHHASQKGEFNGIPPTGKHVVVPGIEMLRVRDGQIVEFWHLDNFLSLMQQLGVIPQPRATEA